MVEGDCKTEIFTSAVKYNQIIRYKKFWSFGYVLESSLALLFFLLYQPTEIYFEIYL